MKGALGRSALAAAAFALLLVPPIGRAEEGRACSRCGWRPPATKQTTRVRTMSQLYDALGRAQPDTTILIANGEYRLAHTIEIAVPRVVVRSESGDPASVVLRGDGMNERQVGVAIAISATDVTIADLTVGDVGFHGVQVRGERGASRATLHDLHVVDTGQQLVKGSTAGGPAYADDGVVACSTLEYRDHAPSDYTNAVDIIGGKGWTVRDNTIRRIHGPAERSWSSGPAILFWGNSQDTQVERNLIVDSFRGIAFGLGPGASQKYARDHENSYDHQGGSIRNNAIVNLNRWADEGIEANAARGVTIDHNTVLVEGQLAWSISMRFGQTAGDVRNNLTSRAIVRRDGGQASLAGNVSGARADWFVNAPGADLHLARPNLPAVDAGVPIPDLVLDAARQPRTTGRGADAGAFEFRPSTP